MTEVESGEAAPLVLVHGLGGNRDSWKPIIGLLTPHRSLVMLDLPSHGGSKPAARDDTFQGLADWLEAHLAAADLAQAPLVGSSMGARLVLEMARRGPTGPIIALDPGGFWSGWERSFFKFTIGASARLLRLVDSHLPKIVANPAGRSLLLAQLSAHPARLDPVITGSELQSYARTPSFDALTRDLAHGPMQTGPAHPQAGPITIGWGRHDRLCLPRQAARAQAAFPGASLHWFEHSGHFPHWDEPEAAAALILRATAASS
jgi:pimeloyl-ACP methyl ester carboxylesterase